MLAFSSGSRQETRGTRGIKKKNRYEVPTASVTPLRMFAFSSGLPPLGPPR